MVKFTILVFVSLGLVAGARAGEHMRAAAQGDHLVVEFWREIVVEHIDGSWHIPFPPLQRSSADILTFLLLCIIGEIRGSVKRGRGKRQGLTTIGQEMYIPAPAGGSRSAAAGRIFTVCAGWNAVCVYCAAGRAYAVVHADYSAAARAGPALFFCFKEGVHAVLGNESQVADGRFKHGIGVGITDFLFYDVAARILFAFIAESAFKIASQRAVNNPAADAAALRLVFIRPLAAGAGRNVLEPV